MLYANIHQLYSHILQTENFFIQHPFQPLSAVNTTTKPKVLQPKLHDIKKKRCFVPKYTSYTAIYCDRNIYSKSTPSGCFQHAKIPLIPNFGVLFHRVTPPLYSADSADWTILALDGSKIKKNDFQKKEKKKRMMYFERNRNPLLDSHGLKLSQRF